MNSATGLKVGQLVTIATATGGPWRGPVGNTQATLQRELNDRWLPYIKREIGKVESTQALIDSTDEYERVAKSCDGEIRKRLK